MMTSAALRMTGATVVMTILVAAGLGAQSSGVVTGRVLDSASAIGREGISVSVTPARFTTTTSAEGRFAFGRVPAGSQRLSVRAVGFVETVREIVVRPGETTFVELRVSQSATTLDAVRVDAAAAEREAFTRAPNVGAIAISARAMQAIPKLGEMDPVRVVAMTPGIQARNDFSTGFNARGGESDQNLILVDGYPIYNPFHLGGLFSTFIGSSVRNIELRNGAMPARYGGRLSSLLQVQSREDPRPGVHGTAEVSVLASTASAGGALGDRGTWFASGRRTYADKVIDLISDDRLPYHFYDGLTHVSYRLPAGFRLGATGYVGRDVLDGSFGEISDSTATANEGRFYLSWGNQVGGVTLSHSRVGARLGDSLVTEQSLSLSRFNTMLDAGSGARTFDNRVRDLRAFGSVARYGATHTLTAGYDLARVDISYTRGSPTGALDFIQNRQRPSVGALYAEDLWKARSRLLVSSGVRVEGSDNLTPLPRLSAKYLLTERSALTVSAGRYAQWLHSLGYEDDPIRMFDYWRSSDASAPVSTAWQYALGHERWLTPMRLLRIEGFYKRYRNLVEPNNGEDPRVEGDEFLTFGGESYGGDLLLRAFEAGPFSGWLAYTWTKSHRWNDTMTYPPAQDRRHDINVIGSWRFGAWTVGTRASYASGTPFTEPTSETPRRFFDPITGQWGGGGVLAEFDDFGGVRNGARYPATRRLDIHVERQFTRRGITMTPYVSVVNVTDQRNVLLYIYRYSSKPAIRQTVTQFPFLPSGGMTIAF